MLPKLLLNIITFGGMAWKELKELEKERDNLHSAIHSDYDKEKLKKMIIDAEKAKAEYEKKQPRYAIVKPFDATSFSYQKEIYGIANNEYFIWLMYKIEQDVFNLLNSQDSGQATEIMGLAKGVEFVKTSIREVTNAYLAHKDGNTPSVMEDDIV